MMRALTRNQSRALACLADASRFDLPPEEGGQIVQTSYACSPDWIYAWTTDRSDRTAVITAYQHPAGSPSWDPWNTRPQLGRGVGAIWRGMMGDEPIGRRA